MNHFTDLELQMMLTGSSKIIKELQKETLQAYPEVVKTAIQNELQMRYSWNESVYHECERRAGSGLVVKDGFWIRKEESK